MKMHEISISDPMLFELPNGSNKILAEGLGLVYGSPAFQVADELYLLKVIHPFVTDGDEVRYLLVSPRYVSDTLKDAVEDQCIVGISRLKPGITLDVGDEYNGSEYEYWAIGSIKVRRA